MLRAAESDQNCKEECDVTGEQRFNHGRERPMPDRDNENAAHMRLALPIAS